MDKFVKILQKRIKTAYEVFEESYLEIRRELKEEEISSDSADLLYEDAEKGLRQEMYYLVWQAEKMGFSDEEIHVLFEKEYRDGIID